MAMEVSGDSCCLKCAVLSRCVCVLTCVCGAGVPSPLGIARSDIRGTPTGVQGLWSRLQGPGYRGMGIGSTPTGVRAFVRVCVCAWEHAGLGYAATHLLCGVQYCDKRVQY
eukprot:3935001-Rhodomonas_salina.1